MGKILLTGGSGFIGSHFHNFLNHAQLINLDLTHPFFDHRAEFIQGDIRIMSNVADAVAGKNVSTIISLAAKHHDFGIGHDEYFDTNEAGTAVICDVATKNGINDIIFFSSVAVYGLLSDVSSENVSPKPDGPYGASKLAGEKVLEDWCKQDPNRRVLVMRPTVVFGAHNKANMYNLIRQIDRGRYFHISNANNIKSIAYVENVVQATLFLKDRLPNGFHIFNYADEPHLRVPEIADLIAQTLNKKIRLYLPFGIAMALGRPFDWTSKLTGKNLPISTVRIKKLATQTFHSAGKIFELGFKPSFSTKEGLVKMVEWYKTLSSP